MLVTCDLLLFPSRYKLPSSKEYQGYARHKNRVLDQATEEFSQWVPIGRVKYAAPKRVLIVPNLSSRRLFISPGNFDVKCTAEEEQQER